ncbi:hypothetical protein GCM10022226_51590 [Sphaerisporangium flaviroseum]|uniref:Uncharacterized protein n=1 Tax=Sphaerisporangium flaviroseum TaxID=509199 RepID=A0ABP7IRD1_9ACTN
MARARLLHRVHREGAYDVDRAPIEVAPLKVWHEFATQLLDLLLVGWRRARLVRPSGMGFHATPDPNGSIPSTVDASCV